MGGARKSARGAGRGGLPKPIRFLWGPGRPLLVLGVLAAIFVGGWHLVWRRVRPQVLASEDYLVTPERVHVTPLPEWIHTDIRAEVFRNASLDGPLSIMDDNLTERISQAFSLHPWVAKVHRVSKHHPARVEVQLVFRRPVCMVEVPGGLLPVDAQGVLLPAEDFSTVEAASYPRLAGVSSGPVGTVGEGWGDVRVIGGAEIAAAVFDAWEELGLWKIVPSGPLSSGATEEYTYTILTRGGTRIVWGRPPCTDVPGELSAAEKLARLRRYYAEHGSLEGRQGTKVLDLHGLRVSSRGRP